MLQLIISLLAVSGLGAILALLLEIADSYIADYGESHILINEEKEILVQGGSPLLSSLMEESIFIPSACGGKGTCALCKLRVLEGGGPVLPTETPYLSKEELVKNVRLSCQIKVRNDLKIQIPEELFHVREFRVRVERMEDLSSHIKGLRLKILDPETGISFRAGQYIQLGVPEYALTDSPEHRAYSVASDSEDMLHVDLIITKVQEGEVTTYVHDYLNVGEELHITGPFGDFYLRDSDKEILLIATGSGLAPMKSILHQIEQERIGRKTTLFFGARTRKDLLYYETIRGFEERLHNFRFTPTLSRSTEEDRWEGERGRVTHLIEKHVPTGANIQVYICGAPVMVESCEELLKNKGIAAEDIFYDKFE